MHEHKWLEALVASADFWADELKDDHTDWESQEKLCQAVKAIHHIGEICHMQLMDKYRETKSVKL